MSGELSIRGEWRVVLRDPDTRRMLYDTGPMKNTICKGGIQNILFGLAGGIANVSLVSQNRVDHGPDIYEGSCTGGTHNSYISSIHVGVAGAPLDFWYIHNVYVYSPRWNYFPNTPSYETSLTMSDAEGDDSYIVFRAPFTGIGNYNLDFVALADDTGENVIAGSEITPAVNPNGAQVDVTYTIYMHQTAAP